MKISKKTTPDALAACIQMDLGYDGSFGALAVNNCTTDMGATYVHALALSRSKEARIAQSRRRRARMDVPASPRQSIEAAGLISDELSWEGYWSHLDDDALFVAAAGGCGRVFGPIRGRALVFELFAPRSSIYRAYSEGRCVGRLDLTRGEASLGDWIQSMPRVLGDQTGPGVP